MPKREHHLLYCRSFLSPFGTGGSFSEVLKLEFSKTILAVIDSDEPKADSNPFSGRKGLDFTDTSKVAVKLFL